MEVAVAKLSAVVTRNCRFIDARKLDAAVLENPVEKVDCRFWDPAQQSS
jgi:hypothetical protein